MSLNTDQRYQVNEVEVADKVIEGEAVMINLANGTYYSMDGTGAAVWELLTQHHNLAEIAGELSRNYRIEAEPVFAELATLLDELLDERLLLPTDRKPNAPLATSPVLSSEPYAAPQLNTYRDMGDMLALDPPMPGLNQIPWEGDQGT